MRLYIIRHGETEWNKVKRLQGQTDIPLAENGIALARITGENMMDIPFDLVISSPLSRARQTAEYVLNGRTVTSITDERIKEMSFGEWEGECLLDSKVLPENFLDLFLHDPKNYVRPPKGENFEDVYKRTGEFYQELIHNKEYQDYHILISTHGAAGRCLLSHCYHDGEIWRGGVPKNCAVSIVEVLDGESKVLEKDKIYY